MGNPLFRWPDRSRVHPAPHPTAPRRRAHRKRAVVGRPL